MCPGELHGVLITNPVSEHDNPVFVDYNSIDRIQMFPELVVIPDGWRVVKTGVRHAVLYGGE